MRRRKSRARSNRARRAIEGPVGWIARSRLPCRPLWEGARRWCSFAAECPGARSRTLCDVRRKWGRRRKRSGKEASPPLRPPPLASPARDRRLRSGSEAARDPWYGSTGRAGHCLHGQRCKSCSSPRLELAARETRRRSADKEAVIQTAAGLAPDRSRGRARKAAALPRRSRATAGPIFAHARGTLGLVFCEKNDMRGGPEYSPRSPDPAKL